MRFQQVGVVICAFALGCGMDDEQKSEVPSSDSGCTLLQAGQAWWNQTFPDQTGRFHAEFDATPSATNIDAVVGLSSGRASTFTSLAAIVRFNPSGYVDARSGDTYTADTSYAYAAGSTYHIRLDVDLGARTYSVWIAQGAGNTFYAARLATDYTFRTEQAGVTHLANVASKIDSASGTLEICGFTVVADVTTGDGCATVSAADGFAPIAIPDSTTVEELYFTVQASAPTLDAVIGLSAAPATTWSDLATAVRFGLSGDMDFRDGDNYRADTQKPYGTGTWQFRLIADLSTHTYSVVEIHSPDSQEVARQYAFRTQQAGATHLGYLNLVIDGSDSPPGTIKVCGIGARQPEGVPYTREGTNTVLPLADNAALISDGTSTTRVDAAGHTVASHPFGGALAVDAAGDVFIASVTGNALTVEMTDPNFTSRWRATGAVAADAKITAMQTDASGTIYVGLVQPQDASITVYAFDAGGSFLSQSVSAGMAVAFDTDGAYIAAWQDGDMLRITKRAANSAPIWQDSFAGRAGVTTMAVAPNHAVVFGGGLNTPIDFGGGTIDGYCNDNAGCLEGFWGELAGDGSYVYAMATDYDTTIGVAANASRIAISTTERTQFHYVRLGIYDLAGHGLAGDSELFGEHGFGGAVALGPTNRVWWNVNGMIRPVDTVFPYTAAIDF